MRTLRRSAPTGRRTVEPSWDPAALPRRAPLPAHHPDPVLDVVVPVFNEENDLEPCVRRLHAHLAETFPYPFRITIADNASTDRTPAIAARLAAELPGTGWLRLAEQGRGRALHAAWSRSTAPVLAYLDVDLSTDLAALLPLVAPLISGHSDIAIGTRLARGSRVVRGPKREFISRCYNGLLRGTLAVRFSDAQCGFKAVRRDVAERLLPLVEDQAWFFDTELLVIAERAGLRIHEVPVDWVDDPDSRVRILSTALADLRGMARLGRALACGRLPLAALRRPGDLDEAQRLPPGLVPQLLRFATVGVASTLFYLLLYTTLRPTAGAQAANALALLASALANTAANRRLTFGVRGRNGVLRHQLKGLAAFLFGLALTSGALAVLHRTAPGAGSRIEVAALIAANLAATLLRFLLFRAWVFPARHTRRRTTGRTAS
ncbi:dolichyl-phosphate beta-glucosyltransferase [Streptomyces sp. NPDC052682]|uniref:dolichyl-phosphate beta-glucosyltransferase n=1 Tax=Streptomyces sp. NPDC052682 TaxID=3154954 RepID=UPI00343BF3A8